MIRPFARGIACLAIFMLFAAPALAEEEVHGSGFRVSIPGGYTLLPASEGGDGPVAAIQAAGGDYVKGTPEVHVYYAGSKTRPDSVIVISRIELADGREMHDIQDLMDYVHGSLNMTPEQFERLIESNAAHTRTVRVGSLDAFEMEVPPAGGEPSTRTLTAPAGRFLVVLVLMSMDDMASSAESTWGYLVGSLHVENGTAFLHTALLYGGIALGLLLLLVLLVRSLSSVRRQRMPLGASVRSCTDGWEPAAGQASTPERPAAMARTLPSSPVAAPSASAPTPMPAPSAGESSAPGARLIATLPPSGRWEA